MTASSPGSIAILLPAELDGVQQKVLYPRKAQGDPEERAWMSVLDRLRCIRIAFVESPLSDCKRFTLVHAPPTVERHLTINLNSNPDGVVGNCKFNSAAPRGPPSRGELRSHGDTLAAQWAALDEHFQNHVRLVERFRDAGPEVVARMWMSQTNEGGHSVSQFERDALIERHCELFGTWPDLRPAHHALRSDLPAAELERADLCIVKTKQHIAD